MLFAHKFCELVFFRLLLIRNLTTRETTASSASTKAHSSRSRYFASVRPSVCPSVSASCSVRCPRHCFAGGRPLSAATHITQLLIASSQSHRRVRRTVWRGLRATQEHSMQLNIPFSTGLVSCLYFSYAVHLLTSVDI